MKVVLDSDGLVYLVGFSCQSSDYRVTVLDDKDEVQDVLIVSGLGEVRALESQLKEGERIETDPLTTEEPLEHALGSTKRSLLAIEHALRVEHGLSFLKMELFLTGTGNYRDEYAKIRGYKANRAGVPRPVHYEAIRSYMITRWGATVVDGIEADDAVATIAHAHQYDPEKVCIVSPDKDLLTVPGRLYNSRTRKMRIISPDDARLAFYRQMLTGDVTDNVLGCFRCGEKSAEKIVVQSQTEVESAEAVLQEFEASLKRAGCPYADRTARDVMRETGILLHMQRTPGEIWELPI